jgi:acyl-homoserine lactone acylase PvdQ
MIAGTARRLRSRRMTRPGRWALVVMVLGALATSPGLAGATGTGGRPSGQGVLVRRTAHGIPHILAADYRGLGFGAGYAFAEDNLCLLADKVVTLSAQRSRWFGAEATTTAGLSNSEIRGAPRASAATSGRWAGRPLPAAPAWCWATRTYRGPVTCACTRCSSPSPAS